MHDDAHVAVQSSQVSPASFLWLDFSLFKILSSGSSPSFLVVVTCPPENGVEFVPHLSFLTIWSSFHVQSEGPAVTLLLFGQ